MSLSAMYKDTVQFKEDSFSLLRTVLNIIQTWVFIAGNEILNLL